jgi:hypothetical protein
VGAVFAQVGTTLTSNKSKVILPSQIPLFEPIRQSKMHSNECSDTIMISTVILQHWRVQDQKTNIRIDLKAEF